MEQGWTERHGQNVAWQGKGFVRETGWGIRWRGDKRRKGV